jgi:hypothetical protein
MSAVVVSSSYKEEHKIVAKTISGGYLQLVLHCPPLPIKFMADLYIAAPLGACCCSALIYTKLHSQNVPGTVYFSFKSTPHKL